MNVIATHLEQETCYRCDRPPLTFDAQDRALCARHATIFLAAPRFEQVSERAGAKDRKRP
jgi:hypothetical protein